jgi:transmembrane protein 33
LSDLLVTLIPFGTFSLFHSIGYLRTELIPKVFPNNQQGIWVSSLLSTIMTKYQPISINAVARAEIWMIFPMTIVSIFWGGASVFIPFLYFQFIQFRYLASSATRVALQETEVVLDKLVLQQAAVPPMVQTGYSKAKEMLKKYGDLEAKARAQQAATAPQSAE